MIKSGLILAKTNAESERCLLINTRVVTSDRSAAPGEAKITGLCIVKEAVRLYDPVNGQTEDIAFTKDLKPSVQLAHAAHKARLETERQEHRRMKLNKRGRK